MSSLLLLSLSLGLYSCFTSITPSKDWRFHCIALVSVTAIDVTYHVSRLQQSRMLVLLLSLPRLHQRVYAHIAAPNLVLPALYSKVVSKSQEGNFRYKYKIHLLTDDLQRLVNICEMRCQVMMTYLTTIETYR